jgi:hypothetical protein
MVCAAVVRIGAARQSFWALWDRTAGILRQRTRVGAGAVSLTTGRLRIAGLVDLVLAEAGGVETVCPAGASYAWTRKQGGVHAAGTALLAGRKVAVDARAVIDDTAAYYPRHTSWEWCAGVGRTRDGQPVAWNLVSGVNDPVQNSERTVCGWTASRGRSRRCGSAPASGSAFTRRRPGRARTICCWSAAATASRSAPSEACYRTGPSWPRATV